MDNKDGLTAALAQLIGLPTWFPRAVTRAAALALAVTYLLSPQTVIDAFNLYVAAETQRLLDVMQPMLTASPSH